MDAHSKEISSKKIDDLGSPTIADLYQEVAQLRTTLTQADALWRDTFAEAAIGMVHLSLDQKWLRVNQHFCTMLGYTVDELLAKTIQELTYPDDWTNDVLEIQRLTTGEIKSYVTNKRYIHHTGTLVWGRLTLRIAHTKQGSPDYFIAIVEDITNLKQTKVALEISEERYHSIVEDQVDPICRFDPDFCLTFVNGSYAQLYEKSPETLIGQNLLDFVVPAYRPQVLAHLSSMTPQNPLVISENPVTLANGSELWFHWTNRRIELPDGTIEYQGVGRDITKRKQADDAERQQRQFAETMRDNLATLTSSLDLETVIAQLLASVATMVPNDACHILLLEEDYGQTAYTQGYSPEAAAWLKEYASAAPIRPTSGSTLDSKHSYIIADMHTASTVTLSTPLAWVRSSIGVKITVNDQIIGFLVANSTTPNLYQPTDLEKLQTFADYASIALHNAYLANRLEQRVAERTTKLQAAKEQVEAILNHSSDSILFVQPDLHIVQSNAVFQRSFPSDAVDFQGQSLLDFVHPDNQVAVQDEAALVLRDGDNRYLQIRAGQANNGYFDAELSLSRLDNTGLVCTLGDITERKAHERQLLYYASLQENVTDAVIVVDMDDRIQSWNNAAETVLGWRAAEVIGQMTINVLYTLGSDRESREIIRQTLFEQGCWQGEVIHHHKDGTPRNILASITLLRDAQHLPFGVVAILRDVTKQKQTELALNESRYFTKRIVDMAPSIIHVYDLVLQQNTYINNNLTHVLGYSIEEFNAMGDASIISEMVHPDDVDLFLAHRKRVVTGKDEEIFTTESRQRHKNGSWRWLSAKDTILQRSADGTPTQILGTVTDITESKQATERLRRQHDFLQQIIDHVPAIIMVKDRAGIFQLVNERAARVYGMTAATMVGQTEAGVNSDPAELAIFRQKDEEVFTTRQPIFIPEQMILGAYHQVNKIPLTNEEGEIDRLLVVAVDISMHKQAEVALEHALQTEKELNEHKLRFISTASHEFRTPLTSILMKIETLHTYRHRLTDEQIEKRLQSIQVQGRQFKAIMEDVLELATIQAGRVKFTPQSLSLDELCRTIIEELQPLTEASPRLLYHCDGPIPLVNFDKRLMRYVITNLVTNGLKYSPALTPVVIRLTVQDTMLVLQVEDQGIGIPEADLPHIFKPFHRASNVGVIQGTGLGLVILKEAVELHGGTITVTSQLGVGTTFVIAIPIVDKSA